MRHLKHMPSGAHACAAYVHLRFGTKKAPPMNEGRFKKQQLQDPTLRDNERTALHFISSDQFMKNTRSIQSNMTFYR